MASDKVQTLSDSNFQQVIGSAATPVLVDFWAEWCGPCRMIAPTIDALATELEGKLTVAKMNVDDNPMVPSQFGVRSIPTLLVFKGGKVVDQVIGVRDKAELKRMVEKHF
jgi:thioredoxin 1